MRQPARGLLLFSSDGRFGQLIYRSYDRIEVRQWPASIPNTRNGVSQTAQVNSTHWAASPPICATGSLDTSPFLASGASARRGAGPRLEAANIEDQVIVAVLSCS